MAGSSHNFDFEGEINHFAPSEVNNSELSGHSDIFFAAVAMTRMPMVVTNPSLPDNPIVFANEAFAEMTGYDMSDIINRNCRFLQGPDTNQESIKQIRENIKNRDHTTIEILNYRKDGTPFWNALFISPIYNKNDDLVFFFGSQLDVTRRRNAENALHQAQKLEAVGQLTGGLAHDFNNLLTLILGNAKLLRKIVGEDTKTLKYIDRINEAALKGQTLTQQMLAFARKQQLEARPIDVSQTLNTLNDLLSKTLGSEIEIEFDLTSTVSTVRVDVVQFELAIINILVNARDALEGAASKKVHIRTYNEQLGQTDAEKLPDAREGRYVVIAIKDSGMGMPPDVVTRVTEPFFTTKDIGKGSGLGLSQVYGFTRQSKGFLHIVSEVTQGTEIRLYFPACDLKPEKIGLPAAATGKTNQKLKATILLVDDNVELLEMAKEILENDGYQVLAATSGKAALEIVNSGQSFDILFSDIAMPGGINGITLAEQVKQHHSDVKIILTTGFAHEYAGQDLKTEFPVIQKPYDTDELLLKFEELLQ